MSGVINFLQDYSVLWLGLALFILIYAAVIKIKLPGSKFILAVLSLILTIILVTSTDVANFLLAVTPLLTMLLAISFFIILALGFVAKDFSTFAKPLAYIGFVLAILIIISIAFSQFPTMNHLLPSTSNAGLPQGLSEFKNYIYSSNFRDGALFIICTVIVGFFLVKK